MGFSAGNDLDAEHTQLQLIGKNTEEAQHMMNNGGMDLQFYHQQQQHHIHGVEVEVEFWPLEHPMEPLDEDRPVKCPMEDSSLLNDGGMHKERYGESSWRKRSDNRAAAAAAANRYGGGVVVAAAEHPPRAVRKRQHTLTRGSGDRILNPAYSPNPESYHLSNAAAAAGQV